MLARPGGYLIENQDTIHRGAGASHGAGLEQNSQVRRESSSAIHPQAGPTTDLPLKKIFANQMPDPKLQDEDILYIPVSGAKQWTDKGLTSALQMAVGVVIYGRY